ncbi:MAG: DUF7711 family protein [Janthinobacterium lividum]
MKWTTAVRTLTDVGAACTKAAAIPSAVMPLRITSAWVHGVLLGPRRDAVDDLDGVAVALAADVAEDACPWLTQPTGAGQWLNATGMEKRPVALVFRSAHAPIFNHRVQRPVRFWDVEGGVDSAVLAAIDTGEGERLRPGAVSAAELTARVGAELAVSLAAVRAASADFDGHRWAPGSPLKRADALAAAVTGYLDLLEMSRPT